MSAVASAHERNESSRNEGSGTPKPQVITLPANVSAASIAERSRQAMIAFVNGAGAGWGKREVAHWLAGPYRALTAHAHAAGVVVTSDADSSTFRRHRPVSAARVYDVVCAAKEELLATLLMAAPPDNDVAFVDRALAHGHVVATKDRAGRTGFAPVDAPNMLLADRILSLAAVDYLMRPSAYMALLSVCGQCQAVSFDAQVRVRGHCLQHRRPSKAPPPPR